MGKCLIGTYMKQENSQRKNMFFNDSNIERLITAFRMKMADRVPILEFWPNSQGIIEYVLGRSLEYEVRSAAEGRTDSIDVDDMIEFSMRIGMDAVGTDFVWWPGQEFRCAEDGTKHYVDGKIKDWDAVGNLEPPEEISRQMERYDRYLAASSGTGVGIYPRVSAFFNPTYLAIGFVDFCYKLHDDLPFVEYLMDVFLEHQLEVMSAICRRREVKLLQVDDDIAFKSGLFIDRELFLKLYFERMKSLLEPARENDVLIAYHTDGNLDDVLPLLIELGVNAIHPVEPACNDIYEIKEKYGNRICLCGNIDLLLLTEGNPEDIREDVKTHLEGLMKNGGYVCGTSSSLYDGIPPQNYCELVRTVHECGCY
jgi:uroporphyrinogen decarboxylase